MAAQELCKAIHEMKLEDAETILENDEVQFDINEAIVYYHDLGEISGLLIDYATPLYYATKLGHAKLVCKILSIKGINPNKGQMWHTLSPLHVASRYGSVEIVQMLIDSNAKLASDCDGLTAFHYAAIHGHTGVIDKLIQKFKSGINDVTKMGNTPLQKATEYGHLDIVKMFLENKALTLNRNINGHTAYDIAVSKKHDKIAQCLFKAGGYVQSDRVNTFVNWFKSTKLNKLGEVFNSSKNVIEEGLRLVDDKFDSLFAHNLIQDNQIAEVQHEVAALRDSQNELMGQLSKVHVKVDGIQKKVAKLEESNNQAHCSLGHQRYLNSNTDQEIKMQKTIRNKLEYLIENIESSDHRDYLYQEEALSKTDIEVIESKPGERHKTKEMLYILLGKPQYNWVHIFKDSLERNKCSRHLVDIFN